MDTQNYEQRLKDFIKELSDFAYEHKDGTENQFVSNQDALAAYFIATNIMIKTEGDALLFLAANNLLNVYIKEEHAIKAFDYYFKHSIAIILYYAKMNNFKHLKINYIDKELSGNNMMLFSIYDMQFSFHGIPLFIKSMIPLKYKSHDLFNGVRHKSCVNDLFHMVIKNRQLFSNLTYRHKPLIEEAYQYANTCDLQTISRRKFKNMLPNFCFRSADQNEFNTEAIDKYGLENYVGKRYIVSSGLRNNTESFDKVINYLKKNDSIIVNLPSTADYLLIKDEQDLTNEVRKIHKDFNGKILSFNLENGEAIKVDEEIYSKSRLKASKGELQNTTNPKNHLQKIWGDFYRENLNKAMLEENKGKLATISATLKLKEEDLNAAIELIKTNGYIPCDKIGLSSYIIVKDEEDLKRLIGILKHPYSGQFIKLKNNNDESDLR